MYRHVLVPVAFDEEHDPAPALRVAGTLAAPEGRVTLLHVMPEVPSYAISYMPQGYDVELRGAIQAELDRLAAGLARGAGVIVTGDAGRVIPDWAEENDADCIVIASRAAGLEDYLLGSTTARVVRYARCAVHVVR